MMYSTNRNFVFAIKEADGLCGQNTQTKAIELE